MRRIWKLLKFLTVTFFYAVRMFVSVRSMSEHEKAVRVAQIQKTGGASLCRILGVRVIVKGDIDMQAPQLIVSNHVGLLDPWVLASVFNIAFAAKVEMATWPLVGWVGQATGLIYVDRKSKMKTQDLVDSIRSRMRSGVGVLVFPEGTTNATMELLPFKTGGIAAVENMSDGHVFPIYIWARELEGIGTTGSERLRVAWPEGEGMLSNAWKIVGYDSIEIEVLVGNSIPTAGKSRKVLAKLAQDQVDNLRRSTL